MRVKQSTRIYKKFIDVADMPQSLLSDRGKRFIFPFDIIAGTVNNTELGETADNVKPSNFLQYSKIFTGKDSVILRWRGSTKLVKANETDTFFTKQFQAGEAFSAVIDNVSAQVNTSATGTDAAFAEQSATLTVNVLLEGVEITYNDLLTTFIIPATGTDAVFEIAGAIAYYNREDNDILYSEIVFESLNDKLAISGQALEQYFQMSAAGEGYAYPKENIKEHTYELDTQKLYNNPITDIQIEIFGGGIFTAPLIAGRRIDDKEDKKVVASRLLFPYKMNVPVPSETSKTAGGENNFYFIEDAKVNVVDYFKDWKDEFRDNYDLTVKANYEGVIETDPTTVKATNETSETITSAIDIYDQTWTIPTTGRKIDGSAIALTEDEITLPEAAKVPQLLMAGALAFIDTTKLPIAEDETLIWSSKDIPLIGGFFNALSLGIPWGGQSTTAKVKAKPIFGFIPKTLYDFSSQTLALNGSSTAAGKLPIDIFRNDTTDTVAGVVGSNNISQVFNFSITDLIYKDGEAVNTVELGQADGWLYKGDENPIDPSLRETEGYAIDFIGWKGMSKADYKITAYRYGTPLFQAKYQSRAKFTDAMREWENSTKLSSWKTTDNSTIDYPNAIIPKPPVSGYDNIVFNISSVTGENETNKYTLDFSNYQTATFEDLKLKYKSIEFNIGNGFQRLDGLYNSTITEQAYSLKLDQFDVEDVEVEIENYEATGTGTIYEHYYKYENTSSYYTCKAHNENVIQTLSNTIKITAKRSGTKFILTVENIYQEPELEANPPQCNSSYYTNNHDTNLTVKNITIRN